MPRRTNGAAARCSIVAKPLRITAVATNPPMVRAEPQPTSGASTKVKTSSSIAPVSVTAPATSNPAARRVGRRDTGTSWMPATRIARDISTGTKKTQRQLASVSTPPSTSPRENPVAPVAV